MGLRWGADYSYSAGDNNGNRQLELGETRHYVGLVPWYEYDTSTTRVRTIVVNANDTTGAQAFRELSAQVTLTR